MHLVLRLLCTSVLRGSLWRSHVWTLHLISLETLICLSKCFTRLLSETRNLIPQLAVREVGKNLAKNACLHCSHVVTVPGWIDDSQARAFLPRKMGTISV
ncbi:unnamed protein product [Microthlaspi erraticum]|uniref:Uncharacterized protein n=1 Tax=Microthlaspi erraticum TaxID=1685480 RepID=A0A6D2I8G9_9BRAS|nr:unnamed protein product [Microthlaspi erraticum]